MLDDLEKSVLKIYECCVGENEVKDKEKLKVLFHISGKNFYH